MSLKIVPKNFLRINPLYHNKSNQRFLSCGYETTQSHLVKFLETEILSIGGSVYLDFKVNSGSFGSFG